MTIKKGAPVVIRTYSAGVHFGYLVSRTGKEVELAKSRRVWQWRGAFTLNAVATRGVGPGSRLGAPVATIILTEAIEVLACSPVAAKSLEAAGE